MAYSIRYASQLESATYFTHLSLLYSLLYLLILIYFRGGTCIERGDRPFTRV